MNEKLNYQQAAELIGVPVGTLYAWVCRKQIAHHRYGKRLVRFLRSDLETWIRDRKVFEKGQTFRSGGAS